MMQFDTVFIEWMLFESYSMLHSGRNYFEFCLVHREARSGKLLGPGNRLSGDFLLQRFHHILLLTLKKKRILTLEDLKATRGKQEGILQRRDS